MDATILDISDNGSGKVLVRIAVSDGDSAINVNNVYFNGKPCIELTFPIPIDQEDYIAALQDQITQAIQDRLNSELINRSKQNASLKAIAGLQTLVGQTISATSVTLGNVDIAVDGTVTAKPISVEPVLKVVNP